MSAESARRKEPRVSIDPGVWTRIVFAAQESEDWKLKTLIDQAVAGARFDVLTIPSPSEPTFEFRTED